MTSLYALRQGDVRSSRMKRCHGLVRARTFPCTRNNAASTHHQYPDDVFVIDFDGVLCDSVHEVMSAGMECAQERWPEVFSNSGGVEEHVWESLCRVRPRLVKGYESMLMARILVEQGVQGEETILSCEEWAGTAQGMVQQMLDRYDCTESELERFFESWRMRRIENDVEGWMNLNPLYAGVKDALDDCQSPFYIASSKSGKRLIPLLNHCLDMKVDEDSPRVFSGLIPPNPLKLGVLETVMTRPVAQNERTQLHFIDDRFETLEYICHSASNQVLDRYSLYLASWGYCTEEEKEKARGMEQVRVLELDEFLELIRFGIIMKVNDGCQDTEEETINNVYKKR